MLSTSRVALSAMLIAAPLTVAGATTPGQTQAIRASVQQVADAAKDSPTATPGFDTAQADSSGRQAAGMQAQDDEEDESGGATAPQAGGQGMMGGGMMGGGSGMMGQGMGGSMRPTMQMMQGMMQTMQGMMQMLQSQSAGPAFRRMMPGRFVEGHLAAAKMELRITDAQEPQWNAFADAIQARMKAMQDMRGQMMKQARVESWPDRIARRERRLSASLDSLKALEGPTKALWDVLSPEQRQKAEEIMPGPFGMK